MTPTITPTRLRELICAALQEHPDIEHAEPINSIYLDRLTST
jgi:hypothetical protein